MRLSFAAVGVNVKIGGGSLVTALKALRCSWSLRPVSPMFAFDAVAVRYTTYLAMKYAAVRHFSPYDVPDLLPWIVGNLGCAVHQCLRVIRHSSSRLPYRSIYYLCLWFLADKHAAKVTEKCFWYDEFRSVLADPERSKEKNRRPRHQKATGRWTSCRSRYGEMEIGHLLHDEKYVGCTAPEVLQVRTRRYHSEGLPT